MSGRDITLSVKETICISERLTLPSLEKMNGPFEPVVVEIFCSSAIPHQQGYGHTLGLIRTSYRIAFCNQGIKT